MSICGLTRFAGGACATAGEVQNAKITTAEVTDAMAGHFIDDILDPEPPSPHGAGSLSDTETIQETEVQDSLKESEIQDRGRNFFKPGAAINRRLAPNVVSGSEFSLGIYAHAG